MQSLFLVVFLFISLAFALPSKRLVPVSNCQPVAGADEGSLTSSNGLLGFFINSKNQVEYNPSSGKSLEVIFEACHPNFGQYEDPIKQGHLIIRSTGQCLGVRSLEGPTFTLAAVPCKQSDDSSQAFLSWIINSSKENQFFFPGVTNSDKSIVQGADYLGKYNCGGSGFFGYAGTADGDGTPREGVVTLQCSTMPNTFGFGVQSALKVL